MERKFCLKVEETKLSQIAMIELEFSSNYQHKINFHNEGCLSIQIFIRLYFYLM